jgi:hypothetical protein
MIPALLCSCSNGIMCPPWETASDSLPPPPLNSAIYLPSSRQRPRPILFPHLFRSRYESFAFRVLPLVVQFRLARLHKPDGDKLGRPSICETTREVRICRFYHYPSSRKPTEIPRIPTRRWKDHQVTQVCCPCAPLTLYQRRPW